VCLATVFIDHSGCRDEVMRDVAWVEPRGNQLLLVSLLGEEMLLQSRIKSIDLLDSRIVLERTKESKASMTGSNPQ
jgi:predicted RNA-binding protein